MKKFIRLLIMVLLIVSLGIWRSHPVSAGIIGSEFTVSLHSRTHQLNWNIAGDITGHNPNILSELTWSDIQTLGFQFNTRTTINEHFTATGSLSYGWIYRGTNQDSDYSGDNRTGEFSRSNNNAGNGNTMELSIALGLDVVQTRLWSIKGYCGFSYHLQHLKMTDGYQTIPPNGSFPGLDSSYTAAWNGLWLGLSSVYTINENLTVDGNFQYHPVEYYGTGNWNLRTDLAHPLSFAHFAHGEGISLSTAINYRFNPLWSAGISVEYGNWAAGPGLDTTFGADGYILGQQQFNQAHWSYWTFTLKTIYRLQSG